MASAFTVKKGRNGKFYFNLKSANGEIILASQGYKTRSGCLQGIASVRSNGASRDRFVEKSSGSGKPYFLLRARNGRVIGQSQMYKSGRSCRQGILAVRRAVKHARLVES